MAIMLARYRWPFLLLATASLAGGFYLNFLRPSTRPSRAIFWLALAFTLLTVVHWGWWRF